MTLTVRSATVTGATTKGSALTHAELDENFNHLANSSGITFTQSGSGAIAGTVASALGLYVHTSQFSTQGNFETARDALTGTIGVSSIDAKAGGAYLYDGSNAIIAQPSSSNWFLGDAGNLTLTGGGNTAVGFRAMLAATTATDCTAVGAEAMKNSTTPIGNTAVGRLALTTNITGTGCTAIGDSSLKNSTANSNTALGYGAATDLASGTANVFVGGGAGRFLASGSQNVIIGDQAMSVVTTGVSNNVVAGYGALNAYAGDDATAIGHQSLSQATGIQNVAVGSASGGSITTGQENVFIGTSAGQNASQKVDAANSIAIGKSAFTTASNQVVLGNSSITETILRGNVVAATGDANIFGTTSADSGTKMLVRGTNVAVRIGTSSSTALIEGVDDTGSASYQPLELNGSTLVLGIAGANKLSINASGNVSFAGVIAVGGATVSTTTALITPAGATGVSSLRVPHGSAPTSPVNGDMWTTTAGLFVQINGSTVGPLS